MEEKNTVLNYEDDGWDDLFLAPELLSSGYEYKLIADNPCFGVYTMPLFSSKFCNDLLAELKTFDNWTEGRHENYPTNDVLIENFNKDLAEIYASTIKNIIVPTVDSLYDTTINKKRLKCETFIIRYNPDIQGSLKLHHDASTFTSLVTLSAPTDYVGGGTFFPEHKTLLKGKQGEVALHPGALTHKHGGRPITSGERYLIVSFCRIDYS